MDVEADEVDLGKAVVGNNRAKWGTMVWDRSMGFSQNTSPCPASAASYKDQGSRPRPNPKTDWKPIAEKLLAEGHILLQTDGARATSTNSIR